MTHTAHGDGPGPSLATYVETRFNLLTESMREKLAAQDAALLAAGEAAKAALLAAKAAAEAASQASDLRYQQRFEAQSDALSAAFLSQQTAMQTAFVVAEKAVQAALAAADRAVSKAELAADKRFEALNELRQMLTDMVGNLVPRGEATQRFDAIGEKIEAASKRIDELTGRINTAAGEVSGGRRTQDTARALWAAGVGIVLALLAIIGFALSHLRP